MRREALGGARIGLFAALTSAMLASLHASERLVPASARPALRDRRAKKWAERVRRIFGVEVIVDGVIPESGKLLVIANHRAALDILVLLEIFGGHIVSRSDLAKWPLIGQAARSVGTIFVDRASKMSGADALREVERALRRNERVIVFPEGTTFEGDEVRPLQTPAFLPAARAGASILPVGIAYRTGSGAVFVGEAFGAHLLRATREPHTRVAICVGEPRAPGQATRAPARRKELLTLGEDLREDLQRLVARARSRVDA